MSYQEEMQISDVEVLPYSEESTKSTNHLSVLQLSSFPTGLGPAAPAAASVFPDRSCTFCGDRNAKRRSPSSSLTPSQEAVAASVACESEPRSKKTSLHSLLSTARRRRAPRGFTKIPVPRSSSAAPAALLPTEPPSPSSIPAPTRVLRRCWSDPVGSRGSLAASSPESTLGAFSNPQSLGIPANAPNVAEASPSPAKPPLPPALRRSVSDPTSSPSQTPPTGKGSRTVWLPPRTASPNSSSGEMGTLRPDIDEDDSPNGQRLKRMKEKMKEMGKLCYEVMRAAEEEEASEEGEEMEDGGAGAENTIAPMENGSEEETEEAVSVENFGDCFCIRFKCPCSKDYEILFSGKNCYYKVS